MDANALGVLSNREVLAIDQDPAGRQGDRVWSQGPLEVWSRPLADGSIAVGLFNRNQGAVEVPLDLKLLGLTRATRVRDPWLHKDLAPIEASVSLLVAPHGVRLLVLHP